VSGGKEREKDKGKRKGYEPLQHLVTSLSNEMDSENLQGGKKTDELVGGRSLVSRVVEHRVGHADELRKGPRRKEDEKKRDVQWSSRGKTFELMECLP